VGVAEAWAAATVGDEAGAAFALSWWKILFRILPKSPIVELLEEASGGWPLQR
jgi:hypothetical protein